ncbi:MAG: preprotein translocase subunit SecE [Gallionellales bacterium CG08_land_8_20_14_0_20_59_87]|nr:MAG: preprotein translocase subunit SecE [Gallionellales bacterium CG08_land_8_20_14_0_20_59_87]
MADKIKLLIALLLIVAGVVGFYALGDAAAVLRVASVLLGVLAAAGMFWTSSQGKRFFGFAGDSVNEAKRVVWPTRKETMQTTGIVILFAVVMALFLWAVDASLLMVVNKLMGRGD